MKKKSITRVRQGESMDLSSLEIYSVNLTKNGTVRSVRDYINTQTKEVIPAEELSIPVLDLRAKLAAREKALDSLRPEVRAFAVFVLHFANQRRGITPGISVLCRWYAEMTDRRSQDVRRYIPALKKAEILAGESLLSQPFQRTGGTKIEHDGEDYRASCVHSVFQRKDTPVPTARRQAAAPEIVAAELAKLNAEQEYDRIVWGWMCYRPRANTLRAPKAASSPLSCTAAAV